MKKLLVKSILVGISLLTITFLATACTKDDTKLTVGINQFAPHPSLDNCVNGFIEGLAQEGFKDGENIIVDLQNAQADGTKANSISTSFVSKNYDLICGVATPSAQSAFNSAEGKIPVVFSAVTDPKAAMIVDELSATGGNITGTSDELPVEAQLKLIRAFMPNAIKIGILYTTSEVNSQTMIDKYNELAPTYGFEIVTVGINMATEIPAAADKILGMVDCMTNLLDNTVVSSLPIIMEKANAKGIPVFGSEEEQLKSGCIASQSLDYFALGIQTGKMAAQILKGTKAEDIPVFVVSAEDCEPVINPTSAELFGIEIPSEFASARQIGGDENN